MSEKKTNTGNIVNINIVGGPGSDVELLKKLTLLLESLGSGPEVVDNPHNGVAVPPPRSDYPWTVLAPLRQRADDFIPSFLPAYSQLKDDEFRPGKTGIEDSASNEAGRAYTTVNPETEVWTERWFSFSETSVGGPPSLYEAEHRYDHVPIMEQPDPIWSEDQWQELLDMQAAQYPTGQPGFKYARVEYSYLPVPTSAAAGNEPPDRSIYQVLEIIDPAPGSQPEVVGFVYHQMGFPGDPNLAVEHWVYLTNFRLLGPGSSLWIEPMDQADFFGALPTSLESYFQVLHGGAMGTPEAYTQKHMVWGPFPTSPDL